MYAQLVYAQMIDTISQCALRAHTLQDVMSRRIFNGLKDNKCVGLEIKRKEEMAKSQKR